MSKAIKWQIAFQTNDPTSPTSYRIDIYAEGYSGTPIQLTAGPQPFVTEEDKSDDFFCPVRSQTGTIQICTRLSDGSILDINDLLPSSNTSNPVQVMQYISSQWTAVWLGYLSCDLYNQAYTEIPENLSLSVISLLEAWKSVYLPINKIETVAQLIAEIVPQTPGHYFTNIVVPNDYSIFEKLINTSIFVEKQEYQNEESTLYELKGSSAYDILSALCSFMGWVAREDQGILYLQVAQGYGLIDGTVTRNMSDLVWRGTDHQRSTRQGARSVSVAVEMGEMNISTGIGGIPYGAFNDEKYQQIGTGGLWVYFLPSENTDAYSNMVFHFYAGQIKMGIENDPSYPYAFQRLSTSTDVDDTITHSIAYMGYYPALQSPTTFQTIYAGSCFARMQFDPSTQPDTVHQNTIDGVFLSLFPGAYNGNTTYTQHIFEMLSTQVFACIEDGYINIMSSFRAFVAAPWVGVAQSTTRLVMDLQVGDKIWNGSQWVNASGNTGKLLMELGIDGTKFKGNWDASMDIDETDGYLIPNFYTENGVKKHVYGRVALRIYPETYEPNMTTALRTAFICNLFFEELSFDYIVKRSVKLSDRKNNDYFRRISSEFKDDITITTRLASWLHNNPSPSLIYEPDGQTPMQKLPYLTSDGVTTQNQRPEMNLLNRMQDYYQQPRTILTMKAKPITEKPLPLVRLNGINDGKVYLPLSEKRDWKAEVCTLICFETPN